MGKQFDGEDASPATQVAHMNLAAVDSDARRQIDSPRHADPLGRHGWDDNYQLDRHVSVA
jgi:hypothetical protein